METSIQYVIYGGEDFEEFCAGADDEASARHYMFIYGQDSPVKLVREITYREIIDQTA